LTTSGIDTDIVQIVEEDSETLWAAGSAGGLWRIRINAKGTQVEAMEGALAWPLAKCA